MGRTYGVMREIPIHRWPGPMRQERPGKSEQPCEQSSNTSGSLSLLSHIHTRTRLQCIVLRGGARGRYSIRPEREGSLCECVLLSVTDHTPHRLTGIQV